MAGIAASNASEAILNSGEAPMKEQLNFICEVGLDIDKTTRAIVE